MSQLEALALTLAIELAVVAAFAIGRRWWPRPAWPRALLVAASDRRGVRRERGLVRAGLVLAG